MLAIIGAMRAETEQILAAMENIVESISPAGTAYAGTLRGAPVVLLQSGVGKVFAAMGAQRLICEYHPGAVLFVGITGAIREGLNVGDAVLMTHAAQHDVDTSAVGDPVGMVSGPDIVRFPGDQGLLNLLRDAAKAENLPFHESGFASGDQFIVDPDKKRAIAAFFDAAVCDMETAAAAQACYAYGVPFSAVKIVSDAFGMNGRDYAIHKKTACAACARIVLRLCALYARQNGGKSDG